MKFWEFDGLKYWKKMKEHIQAKNKNIIKKDTQDLDFHPLWAATKKKNNTKTNIVSQMIHMLRVLNSLQILFLKFFFFGWGWLLSNINASNRPGVFAMQFLWVTIDNSNIDIDLTKINLFDSKINFWIINQLESSDSITYRKG